MLPERYDPKKDPNIDYEWEMAVDGYEYRIAEVITINPDVMGEHPIFTGTQIPIQVIFDFIHEYQSIRTAIDIFSRVYPEISEEQVLQVLHITDLPEPHVPRTENRITKQRIDILSRISVCPRMMGGGAVFTYMRRRIDEILEYFLPYPYNEPVEPIQRAIKDYLEEYSTARIDMIIDTLRIIDIPKYPNFKAQYNDLSRKTLKSYFSEQSLKLSALNEDILSSQYTLSI